MDIKSKKALAIAIDDAGAKWLTGCWASGHLGMTREATPIDVYADAALDHLRERGWLTPEAIEQLRREGL